MGVKTHLETETKSRDSVTVTTINTNPSPELLAEQTSNQVLRLGGETRFLRGKDFCFHCMFEANFSGHNKILGGTKNWGVWSPNAPQWLFKKENLFHSNFFYSNRLYLNKD